VIKLEKVLYLLYGTDSYLCKQEIQKIIESNHIEQESVENYDLDESSIEDALSAAMTIPFLSDYKAVILLNVWSLSQSKTSKDAKDLDDGFMRYIENPNPSTILIIVVPSEKLDSKKQAVKYLLDYATVTLCQTKDAEDLYGKIKNIIKEHNQTIDANALQQFIGRVGSDPRTLENEIDKLLLFTEGKPKIDLQMVREITSRNLEENIFSLVNAILSKDKQVMMNIYQDLIKVNIDPMWMIGVIMNKFQEILYTKELLRQNRPFDEIMKYFQASKGRVYYMVKNAKEIEDIMLMDYFEKLGFLDFQIKSGQIDKELGLEMFLFQIV
jgi:DNA polymerase-3 subunit delta